LRAADPEAAKELMKQAKADIKRRWNLLEHMASWDPSA
jgi:pyruvate-ferredoxin/flavodoxin oxidoreductase